MTINHDMNVNQGLSRRAMPSSRRKPAHDDMECNVTGDSILDQLLD